MSRKSTTLCRPSERSSLSRRSTIQPFPKQAEGKPEESEKFKLRRARIMRLEQEQMLEDEIAVRIIQGLHLSSIMPFDSVRAEFHDLDGLSWPSPRPQSRKSSGLYNRSSLPFISKRIQPIDGPLQGSFTQQELTTMACRVKTELHFPEISISNQEIAEVTFASYKSQTQTSYKLPPKLEYPSLAQTQRGRPPNLPQLCYVSARRVTLG
ncbi:hypothetical protein QCA50_003695 [Cerrena zonata]|uniref:Uncharacterized protein n=1 Tax=Cerrena zonata TaxID=2478898 RepID=A0AAW0GWY7_9APHY